MRIAKTALIAGVVATAATATILKAQQRFSSTAQASAEPAAGSDPSLAQRSPRQLLKNGLDYLDNYGDFDHALSFLNEAQSRPTGLDDNELKTLADGIARAEKAKTDAGPIAAAAAPTVSRSAWVRRPTPSQLAKSTPSDDPVQRVSAEMIDPDEPPALDLPALPRSAPSSAEVSEPAPLSDPNKAVVVKTASEPIYLTGTSPDDPPQAESAKTETPQGATADDTLKPGDSPIEKDPVEAPLPTPDSLPTQPSAGRSEPAPVTLPRGEDPAPEPASAPILPKSEDGPSPLLPTLPAPEETAPAPARSDAPVSEPVAPTRSAPLEEAPVPASVPPLEPLPAPVPVAASPPTAATAAPTPAPALAPAPAADELPPLPLASTGGASNPLSGLSPESLRRVEEIARRQDEEMKRNPRPMGELVLPPVTAGGPDETGPVSMLDLPRAPSPTEPRAIRVIPVPEEFVPLPARKWEPTRKYWAASASCHMPLYFQDAVLERYGQGVEQALGPAGRFFSYPLDDPRQSNQRNQLLQPMYSAGMFITQIATLPYHMIMDPPWEAQYDLGFYRPGDKIPADTYYLPKTGIGPPLRGNRYR